MSNRRVAQPRLRPNATVIDRTMLKPIWPSRKWKASCGNPTSAHRMAFAMDGCSTWPQIKNAERCCSAFRVFSEGLVSSLNCDNPPSSDVLQSDLSVVGESHYLDLYLLPGCADWVDSKLPSAARPNWRSVKRTAAGRHRRSTVLMVDRGHLVLGNTPGVVLLHTGRRWDDQGSGLTVGRVIVLSMPWFRRGMVLGPSVSLGRKSMVK